ncbi:MAG TPA: hypothetical protein VJM33_08050 [Microthrixaceae bacterium]|nr:hypothetical protein [Microthrixaceae bacterium]
MSDSTPLQGPTTGLSPADDLPLHQTSEPIRHVASTDRNFYDRYYFNLHGSSDELFCVVGVGQYPNLGTQDAFVAVRRGDEHRVVRASKELVDRSDSTIGPIGVEVLEGLQRLRVVVEPNEWGIAADLTWDGAMPAYLEPRHFVRRYGRVLFDSTRFAQTGRWTGTLSVGGETFDVTPDRWWGTRDRSWGIRPVGEGEPPGIRAAVNELFAFWNYAPMQFDDFSILYICQEDEHGERELEEAVRIWHDPDRAPEQLGRPEHHHRLVSGTREIEGSMLSFPAAPGGGLEIDVEPLLAMHLMVGTGYGLEPHWRHGMWQGPLVVEGEVLKVDDPRMWGLVDTVSRFTCRGGDVDGSVGHGLHEYFFLGDSPRYGLSAGGGAP